MVKDDQSRSKVNGMGSKSSTMDSINSYGGSRNQLDDSQEASDDVEKARLISQVLELQNTLDDLNQVAFIKLLYSMQFKLYYYSLEK